MVSSRSEKAAKVIKGVTLASLYIILYLGLQLLMNAVPTSMGLSDGEISNCVGLVSLTAAAAAYLIFVVTLWLRGKKRREEYTISFPPIADVLIAAVMSLGFRVLTSAYMDWAESVEPLKRSIENAEASYDFNSMTPFALLAMLISMYVMAPIFEEILFRGIVMTELKRVMPAQAAIILQGILFGAAHITLVQSIFAAVYGIILGYVYNKTGNLTVTMAAHFVFNLSAAAEFSGAILPTAAIGAWVTALAVAAFAVRYRNF